MSKKPISIVLIFVTIAIFTLSILSCNFRPSPTEKNLDWLPRANFYEVPIRNTAKENPLSFLRTNHIFHLANMNINTVVFPPPQQIEKLELSRSKESYYPICQFNSVDTLIGHPDSLFHFIKFIQKRNFKFLMEWPIYYTGKCHEWVEKNPDYYLDNTQQLAPNIKQLDLDNAELRKALLAELIYWMEDYNVDGFVFHGWDKLSDEAQSFFYTQLKANNNIAIISDGEGRISPDVEADAYLNYKFYNYLRSIYKNHWDQEYLDKMLVSASESLSKPLPINFSSTLRTNIKNGTYTSYYRQAYRALTALTHNNRGLSWILGGQEIPTSSAFGPNNRRPVNWSSKGHTAFFGDLLAMKNKNQGLWLENKSEVRKLDARNSNILVYENKYMGYKNAGMFNLSDTFQQMRLDNHLMNLNEHASHKKVQFIKDSTYNLGPWQYIILGNE